MMLIIHWLPTDLASEFGRDKVFQVMREKTDSARHQLPRTLGGAKFGPEETHCGLDCLVRLGWTFRITRLSAKFTFDQWREDRTTSALIARISPAGDIKLIRPDEDVKGGITAARRVMVNHTALLNRLLIADIDDHGWRVKLRLTPYKGRLL